MITVIKTKVPCNKRIGADGKMIDYQSAKAVLPTVKDVKSLKDVHELLIDLEDQPYRAILRGVPRDEVKGKWTTKKAHNYEFPPVHWLCLDYDQPAPEGCPDYVEDPEGAIHWMIEHHWHCLEGVAIAWQLGNSANYRPATEKMSFHLWVWLDEPVIKCRNWLLNNGFDETLTDRSRIHYTASPEGVTVPRRNGFIEGGALEGVEEEWREVEQGEGVEIEWLVCPDWRAQELIKELKDSVSDCDGKARHGIVRGWVLKACTEGFRGVDAHAVDALVSMGRDHEEACGEVSRLVDGAIAKIKSGEIKASEQAQVAQVFADDEDDGEVEDPQAQKREVCGPSLMESIGESEDPIDYLKNHKEKLKSLDEFQVMELEEILMDKGILVESKPKKGQITRGRLGKLVKAAGGGGSGSESGIVRPEIVKKYKGIWENTYCTEKNGAYSYFFYDEAGRALRLASKRDEIDSMCSYITANEKKAGALLFREEFYRDIHENRKIIEWVAQSKPFGKSEVYFERRGDGDVNAIIESSVLQHLELIKNRKEKVEVPEAFERFMDANYGRVWDVMKAALARRFLGNKRSTIWVHCQSNWGKSFFFDIGDFGMTLDNGYDKDAFKGNDPAEMARWIYIFVDEAHRFTKEMKLDTIPFRRLWGGLAKVTMPARILASANEIADLSDGADAQLLNRVVKVNVQGEPLEQALQAAGWTTQKARGWYEALLSRKMYQWLKDWGDSKDFTDAADSVYNHFCKTCQMGEIEDITKYIHDHFWDHFLWDHIYKVGREFRKKDTLSCWASEHIHIDNGSSTDPDRRRVYIKSPDAWRDKYVNGSFGAKKFAVAKAMPSINAMAEILNGVKCSRLPNQKSFKGVYFDISKLENVEEQFADEA